MNKVVHHTKTYTKKIYNYFMIILYAYKIYSGRSSRRSKYTRTPERVDNDTSDEDDIDYNTDIEPEPEKGIVQRSPFYYK